MDADMVGGGVDARLERRDLRLGWGWPSVRAAAYRRRSQPHRQSRPVLRDRGVGSREVFFFM